VQREHPHTQMLNRCNSASRSSKSRIPARSFHLI
jgi:hypothetical protein